MRGTGFLSGLCCAVDGSVTGTQRFPGVQKRFLRGAVLRPGAGLSAGQQHVPWHG